MTEPRGPRSDDVQVLLNDTDLNNAGDEDTDFIPPETGVSITFCYMHESGGASTQTVYLDKRKLQSAVVRSQLELIQLSASKLLMLGEDF